MSNSEEDDLDLGNPLGIANEPIAQTPSDRLPQSEDALKRRRRARALGEDGIDRQSTGLGDQNIDPDGAAGIDMGYGGEGSGVTYDKKR
jgi:hypothetical protein